jgi:hypothetical protein
MATLMSRVQQSGCRSKADQLFRETCRIPVAGLVLATLLLGDVAIVVAAMAAMG